MQVRWLLRNFGSFICGLILSGSLVGAQLVDAATYYVATTGSDSNPGTQASPFRTINRGVKALKPGDTLRVKSGTYAEALLNPLPSGLSASQPTTLEGDPAPNWPILRPTTSTHGTIIQTNTGRSHIRFRNLVLDGRAHSGKTLSSGFSASSSSPIIGLLLENCELIGKSFVHKHGTAVSIGRETPGAVVRNCSIHGWKGDPNEDGFVGVHGFYWKGRDGLIEHNTIFDNNGYGLQFFSSSGGVDNNIFRNNYVQGHTLKAGIFIASGSGNQIYNNIFVGNRHGIRFSGAGTNNHLWNNTIYANTQAGMQITGGTGTIRNNIVYQNQTNISQRGSSGPTLSNNLTTDPKFVNAAGGNFRLQASSPAINKGFTLSAVRTDFAGTTRPQGAAYDIGAFEYTSSTSTPAVSAPANLRMTNAK